jgi:hypothetical protein
MNNLTSIGYKYGTDKVDHGFTTVYEQLLSKYKYDSFNLLEVGVFYGSSIKMWNEYFPNATIYAADNYKGLNGNNIYFPDPERFVREVDNNKDLYRRVKITNLDQSNESDLILFTETCKNNNTKFKIILDDGSHLMRDQQLTFFHLFDLIEDGGIFIMEDTHTSDQSGYDVLPDKSNSTKLVFENIINGKSLSSMYMNDTNKCLELSNRIKYVEHIEISPRSQTTIIFKK